MTRHTLSVLVENKPGVLARVAGLFSRRGFNIDSLAVGPTEHPEVSRMTIGVNLGFALGAMVVTNVARIQPAKLVRGLAKAVERLGVRIVEGTTAAIELRSFESARP